MSCGIGSLSDNSAASSLSVNNESYRRKAISASAASGIANAGALKEMAKAELIRQ
jgi:hypothetical protein